MEIYTIGFTQSTAEHFFGRLKSAGVRLLEDGFNALAAEGLITRTTSHCSRPSSTNAGSEQRHTQSVPAL